MKKRPGFFGTQGALLLAAQPAAPLRLQNPQSEKSQCYFFFATSFCTRQLFMSAM